MSIDEFTFGVLDGVAVPGFALRNRRGVVAHLTAFGARLVELHLPDALGHAADIVLGFDALDGYVASDAYMGATCGRYGSRIRAGHFPLEGTLVELSCNEGRNHAHGGYRGFDRRVWRSRADAMATEVVFSLHSPDGDEGYPGAVEASVGYRLTDDNILAIAMRAGTDRATVINLVHHTYWNLAGHDAGDVRAQRLHLGADFYTPIDDELVPTGEVLRVDDTPFDFRSAKPIGAGLDRVPTAAGGYDHNWCLRGPAGALRLAATLADPGSGRSLDLWTTAPGVQVYTGGHFRDPVTGKHGARYGQYAGIALETQGFPDAPNLPHFPSPRLDPGYLYEHLMEVRLQSNR